MFEPLADLPAGALGFRISGKLTKGEYEQMIAPVYEALRRGQRLSFLIEIDDDFSGLDAGALWEDLKAAGQISIKHRSDWDKVAVVSNKRWIRDALRAVGWLSPGELRLFPLAEAAVARSWLAG